MTSLSVATNEEWKDKNGEKVSRVEWHRVKFFGKLAEIAGEYLKKGGQVYIEGALRTEKYTDKQGIERYSTDIIASEMQMLGGKPEAQGNSASGRPQRAPQDSPQDRQQNKTPDPEFPDDENIPFVTNRGMY